jgi:predicted nucleic acid-binding protein
MGKVVIDTSVVLALFDANDAHHEAASESVAGLQPSDPVYLLSAVVYAEAMVAAARISAAERLHTRGLLRRGFGPVYEVDERVAEEAAMLRAAHRWLRLPDALVLATADVERADVILTCDKRWAKVSPKVQVVGRAGPRPGRAG